MVPFCRDDPRKMAQHTLNRKVRPPPGDPLTSYSLSRMGVRCGSDRPLQPNRKIWDPCPNISRETPARGFADLAAGDDVRSVPPRFPRSRKITYAPVALLIFPAKQHGACGLESTLSAPSQVWASIETKHARAKGRVDQEGGLRVPGVQAGSQDGRVRTRSYTSRAARTT